MLAEFETATARLRRSATAGLQQHERWSTINSVLYNAGTVLVIVCTGVATYVGLDESSKWHTLAPVLTGVATAWVAIDRALGFGPRWAFNRGVIGRYRTIIDELDLVSTMNEPDQRRKLADLAGDLRETRIRESTVPGLGGDAAPAARSGE
jgi:hypothetical protein